MSSHGMTGKRNAMKAKVPTDDRLSIRCYAVDKDSWREAFNRSGYDNFADWVCDALNAEARKVMKKKK